MFKKIKKLPISLVINKILMLFIFEKLISINFEIQCQIIIIITYKYNNKNNGTNYEENKSYF